METAAVPEGTIFDGGAGAAGGGIAGETLLRGRGMWAGSGLGRKPRMRGEEGTKVRGRTRSLHREKNKKMLIVLESLLVQK